MFLTSNHILEDNSCVSDVFDGSPWLPRRLFAVRETGQVSLESCEAACNTGVQLLLHGDFLDSADSVSY